MKPNSNMQNETDSTTRLRKFVRQPEGYAERYGAFELTSRDLDVIELVFRYRHLSADHIRALTQGSKQQITRRLSGLFHHGYLQRYVPLERMRYDLNAGSPVIAYGLDTKGWRALLQSGRVADQEPQDADDAAWRKEYTRRMAWFLEHHLGISNFRCVLELALREGSGEHALLEWDQSRNIRGEVTLRDRTVHRVNPDAFFSIQDSAGGVRNFFLEFDSGTEEHRRIEAKLKAYWWWLQAPAYQSNHHNHERVAVLFVTTGQRRMENMIGTLARMPKPNNPEHGGKGWFRFCVDADYSLDDPTSLLSAIWHTATNPKAKLALL